MYIDICWRNNYEIYKHEKDNINGTLVFYSGELQ